MLKRKITLDFPLRYSLKKHFFGGGGQSLYPSKMKIKGVPPPKEGGRDRSQLCSNRVPPTLELEKKTEDAEELPTQCGRDGKKKRDTGRPTRAWIRIEGSRALKPTNESQLRDNDRQD